MSRRAFLGEVFLGKVLEEFGAAGGSAVPRPRGAWPVTKGAWSIVKGAWLCSLAPPLAVRSGVRRAPGAERDERGLREGRGGLSAAMVAHDELGGLLPIKRTIRVIDAQNQHFREQEVSGTGAGEGGKIKFI